ncbi:MAG: hypothetical protein KKB30_16750 [Proteobacteria bacterium]|nr:hypothetical protein [Pseudomonadota bacterium]MBU1715815.1 hypothetical protein [Pseudomonadota bacterium]
MVIKQRVLILFILLVAFSVFSCVSPAPKVRMPRNMGGEENKESVSSRTMEPVSADQSVETDEPAGPISDFQFEQPGAVAGEPKSVEVQKVLILPEVSHVNSRLNLYADKISKWQPLGIQFVSLGMEERRPVEWEGCSQLIEKTFQGYSQLMELVLRENGMIGEGDVGGLDPWKIYQLDIAYLESGCDDVFFAGASLVSGWLDNFSSSSVRKTEEIVTQYANKGRYEEAIIAYQNLMVSYPDLDVSDATKKVYGISLLRMGEFEKAVAVFSDMLEKMAPGAEARSVERLLADLLLATGKVKVAAEHYRKLADFFASRRGDDVWVADQLVLFQGVDDKSMELPLYLEVFRAYIMFDGRKIPYEMADKVDRLKEVFPQSPFTVSARNMLRQVEDEVRGWFGNRLLKVDDLVGKKDFVQAKAMLEQLMTEDLTPAMREVAQKSLDDLVVLEADEQAKRQEILAQTLAERWDQANSMLYSERYDEAIEGFTALFDTDYDEKAREKAQIAVNSAATKIRRQAASLFVKARKTSDYDRKKEYFLDSRRLLKQIMEKYPESDIIKKAIQNLEILEDQIKQFDPILFDQISAPKHEAEELPEFGGEFGGMSE